MNELTANNLNLFRKRFGNFHDAVIHSVNYKVFSKKSSKNIHITLGVRDLDRKWVNLELILYDVIDIFLKRSSNYTESIIDKLIVGVFDDIKYLNFFPGGRDPDDIQSYAKESFLNKNVVFLLSVKMFFWKINEYQEWD